MEKRDQPLWRRAVFIFGLSVLALVAVACPVNPGNGGGTSTTSTSASTTTTTTPPVTPAARPSVAVGSAHSCALTVHYGVQCWGQNDRGQIGDGTTTDRVTPTRAQGLGAGVSAVAVGEKTTCALLQTGLVRCWGANDHGQIGDGTTVDRSTPTLVQGLGGAAKAIAAAGTHTCALLTTGTVQCWGANGRGELGDGTTIDALAPVTVSGLANVTAISSGGQDPCAITTDATLECWGANEHGQLGDGTTTDHSTPTLVPGLDHVISVSVAGTHTCAVIGTLPTDTSGTVMCWGANDHGQLGDESGIDHYEVSLIAVRPDQANVYAEQLLQATVGKDQRSYVGAVGPAAPGVGPYYFVAPMVVAVPTDPTAKTTAHERIGPARAFFPADADALRQPVPVKFVFDNAAGTHGEGAFGATIVPGTARGAWTLEAVDGHNAILFGSPRPGLHVGYRPEPGDTITGHFTAADIKGPQRLLCHLGFEGAGGSNTMNVTVFVSLKNAAGQLYNYPKTEIANVDAAGPMKLLDFKLDPADVGGAGPYTLILGIGVKGGAIDPAHPPGLFGLRLLPGSSGGPAAPTIKADLAIGDKYLIPGRGRDAKVSIMPFVEVKNLGPDDIPASLVSKIRVQTRYFVGQYGDTVADTQKVVWCVNPLKSSGPLPVGGKAVIMPTHPVELPTGVFTTWTKLLGVRVEILLPLTGEVADPNLANNKYDKMYLPPIVLGDGVGPYEVILYDQKWFKGRSVSYEYKPTLRHKLIPDLGDMNRQASSMKVGDKVRVAVFSEPNFGGWDRQVAGGYLRHSVWRPGPENLPLLGSWHPIPGFPSIGRSYDKALCSLIIMPEAQQYPSGVLLVDSSVWAFDTERFFPLPEDPKVYNVEFHSLGPGNGAVNGCADLIQAFGGTYGVTLYEQPGYQGQSYTFMALSSDQFVVDLNSVGFEDRAWSMKIGAWIPVKP